MVKHTRAYEFLVVIFQIVAYLISAYPLRWFFRPRRVFAGSLHTLTRGSLLVSNHQSMIDPFLVLACMPFPTFLRLLPIHFPVNDRDYRRLTFNPPFFPLLTFLGCFSIGRTVTERTQAIFYIRSLLKRGRTVFLFPEGEIIKERNIKELKQGIDFFVSDAKRVLFVRLNGFNGVENHETPHKRVSFGAVFEPPPQMSVEEMRQYLEHL